MNTTPLMLQTTTDYVDQVTAELRLNGYSIVRDPFGDETIDRVTSELEPHLAAYPNCEGLFYGHNTKRFGSIFSKSPCSHALATHPLIVSVMNTILKPYCDTIQINLTQFISILPGETAQIPHRDDEMFPYPHMGADWMVNCIWALTDFTPENGGTLIWPNSMRTPLTREPSKDDAIHTTMKKGDVVIYLGSTIHCGGANTTQNPRNGLVISYSLGWLRQAENQYLANPPEVAKHYPKELQDLIGYAAHKPNLGWYEGQDPGFALKNATKPAPSVDLMPDEIAQILKEYEENREKLPEKTL